MLTQQTRIGIQITALLTALVGIVNLFSAITPNLPQRAEWLEQFIPFDIRAGGHFFAAVAGFVMLILATNLLRRKRVAWLLTVSMLVVSILSHLIKGLDYEESLLALILLVQLLLMRSVFTAQSDRPSIAQGVQVLIIALLFTLAYGTLGFFLLDGEYSMRFDFPEALLQTLAMFFTADNAGLKPTTQFGRFFADSIYLVGATTIAIALFLLLRPVLLRGEAATISQRQQARQIVEQYGCSSLARFALFDDKIYYFSPSKRSVIAYVPKGRGATALGDPIGPSEDRKEAIASFHQYCQRNDWFLAFYQTLPDDLDLYKILGFQAVAIGQEAIIDLKTFSLQGKAGKNFRTALNRFNRLGYEVKFYRPPIPQPLLQELRVISNEWLQMMQGSEKKFSLGWFDDDYLRECEIAVVRTSSGTASAFANVVPAYQLNEVTIDLMRRCKELEPGTMDFLFISMFERFKTLGYDRFNLGLSALAGVGETYTSPKLEKALHYLYEHLNRFYNFKGLHTFKNKFHPHWEPRYLIYTGAAALPEVVIALIRADSGDPLLDYFKPGA